MNYQIKLTSKKQRKEVRKIMEQLHPDGSCYSESHEDIEDGESVCEVLALDGDGFTLNATLVEGVPVITLAVLKRFKRITEIDDYTVFATHKGLSIGCETVDRKEAVRIAKDILETFSSVK